MIDDCVTRIKRGLRYMSWEGSWTDIKGEFPEGRKAASRFRRHSRNQPAVGWDQVYETRAGKEEISLEVRHGDLIRKRMDPRIKPYEPPPLSLVARPITSTIKNQEGSYETRL